MKLHEINQALISDNVELIGKTVSVRANTAYAMRLQNLNEELGDDILIDTVPNNLKTEKLIEMVVDGQINIRLQITTSHPLMPLIIRSWM